MAVAPMVGTGAWAGAYDKAVKFIDQLTMEEKVRSLSRD